MILQNNISLKDKNWFHTGGNAAFFCEPTTDSEFSQALSYAKQEHLPLFVLGQGANILISDEGFQGLVIRPRLTTITFKEEQDRVFVTAGAGVSMESLIDWCLDHNIIGLEEFSGIPGTVGGSVYINLHYFNFLIEQFLVDATVVCAQTSSLLKVDRTWFNFGYDQSTLQDKNYYLVDATFSLTKATDLEIAYARGRRTEIIRHRYARYPYKNTCGSFFRNFHADEVSVMSNGKKMIYAAYYLDKIGVKGQLSHGDAVVSHQHANMIVNRGNATSADIIAVARDMQKLVFDAFGIMLQPECQLIGFPNYPLL